MLVNCTAYRAGHKIAELSGDQLGRLGELLARPDCFVWVALKDPDHAELEAMRERFNLHELAVEDARKGQQRPKIEEYADSLFVVLNTVEMQADRELLVGEIDVFVGRNYVLSVRHRTRQGFAAVRERCEREPEHLRNGSAFVLYALMDAVVDRYVPVADELESELEGIEERIFAQSSSVRLSIEEVYSLKRRLLTLQHAASPLLEAVGKLYGGRVPHLCQPMQDYFRDVSDHLIRITKALESMREMTGTAIQVNLSLITLSESEVTKKLAAYGALFAVPTAVAGVYGMNFRFMPELEWKLGYPLVLGAMILVDVLLWRRFRRERWL